MTIWGSFDYKGLVELKKKIEQVNKTQYIKDITNEVAQRLYAKVVKRTPVGQYPKEMGKVGGTLRKGWRMAQVERVSDGYRVRVFNPIDYASYVEYGHRQQVGRFVPAIGKRLKQGWVEGQFFLTKSEVEIESEMPRIIERKLKKILEEAFSDK